MEHIGSRGGLDVEGLGEVSAYALTRPLVPATPPLVTEARLFDLSLEELFPIEVAVLDPDTGVAKVDPQTSQPEHSEPVSQKTRPQGSAF